MLIVDDEELVRTGFAMIAGHQDDLEVVGEAPTGSRPSSARELRPDVVLMDLRMPKLDGIEATRRIGDLELDPLPRVLVLTTFDDDESVYANLQAGASGFLLKDAPARELAELLSDRESEVLRFMGKGLTNAAIGERLYVSEATVKTHVSHILTKLDARDRAQAVAFGYEAGLIVPGSLEDEGAPTS